MHRPVTLFLLILCTLLIATAARASQPKHVIDAESFFELKEKIEIALDDEAAYPELTDEQRTQILAALGRIEALLAETGSARAMDGPQQVALVNDQEPINNILTGAKPEDRKICRHERTTGSHRPMVRCRTPAEMRETREYSLAATGTRLESHLRPCDMPPCRAPMREP